MMEEACDSHQGSVLFSSSDACSSEDPWIQHYAVPGSLDVSTFACRNQSSSVQ